MAEESKKIVKRKNDNVDSEDSVVSNNGSDDGSDIGDPWQEMREEDEVRQQKDREDRRRAKQNELLGIDDDHLKWDDETGLVVPIKNLVNFAGRGRDIKERRQSAFGFAHFSTEESSQKQITEFKNDYGIDALLSLLESDDNICRRYSALALGNIVSNNKLAIKCIEFGVLEAMLPLAISDDTDLETRRYCMLAVANMAANNMTHPTILRELENIIILIDSSDEEIQKCSTLVLQNLSANKEIVMELELCIQPLVNLISRTKGKHVPLPDSKLHSVAALRGLCVADVLRLKIINEGVLRAFLQIIDKPPNNAILVEISAILCGFSSLYETHIDLLQPAVLHCIFLLSMGDIVEAQQFGCTTLANLASNSANHEKLIGANAICNLLIICDYNDNKVKSSATRALANFAANSKRHQLLLDEGCLQIMIRILNNADSYNNMFSALFFSILCENNNLHKILSIPEIIQPLFHLIVSYDTAVTETVRYSVLALANLANSGQSHPFILSEIEIQLNSFFNLSSFKDIETQRYLGLLLSNLAENVNSHDLLSTPIALRKVAILFESDEIEVILNGLSFILKLLSTKKDSIRCRISNMFNKIMIDLNEKQENEELLFMISAYFSNITTSSEVRKNLCWDDIVMLLANMLKANHTKNKDVQIHSINALANLRDVNKAVNIMVDKDWILALILQCIQSTIIDIHSSALRLISGISSHKLSIDKLINQNMIHLIGPFVRSPHCAFRKYAYICLANYASHSNGKIDLNDVNLIKCYLNTSIDEKADVEEMRCCLFALANTAFHTENEQVISQSGILIVKTLIDYIQLNDKIVNEYASLLLSNLSVLLPTHSMFGYHDILLRIIKLANDDNNDNNATTVLQSIKCLRNLAFYDEHIHILLECQIIDFIIKFINKRKMKNYHQYSPFIDKQIAGLCYNLSSHPISIKYIARNDLILSVTSLLVSNQPETRRDAARSLSCISTHTDIATPLFLENEQTLTYILAAFKFTDDLDLYHSLAIILGYVFSLKQIQDGKSYKITRTHILSLLRKPNRQIQLAALWATSTGSENVIMKDDEMLQIIASLAGPQLPCTEDTDTAAKNRDEAKSRFGASPLLLKTIRRRALITLVNYAKNEENHKLIISNCSNVIKNAFNLKDCNDVDVILLSAMLLSNLSNTLNIDIHNELIGSHDISTLDLYLGYNNINIQIFATRALSNICNTPKFAKKLILSEKIIPLLCLTTTKGHLLLNGEIASFFHNLTRHKQFIPMILEQHLIPTVIELLKTNTDITLRLRVIKTLQNCCCLPSTLQRMIEVENGVPFLWNLLLKFATNNTNGIQNTQFISAVIKILSLFTRDKNCKYQFLCGLYNNLNFDDTFSMMMETKKTTEIKLTNTENSKPELPEIHRKQKCLTEMETEFKSDACAQKLCRNRLKSLLGTIFYAEIDEKVLILKILKELSGLTELHEIWMSEDLEKDSLSYLTLYSLCLVLRDNINCFELIEIALTVLSQLLLYTKTVSQLLNFDEIQNRFDIIKELQKYGNHEWISIRTLTLNITASLMEYIQHLIATNTERKKQCFEYFNKYYHETSQTTTAQSEERLNGFSLIKLNAKIPDIRLQAQASRLLAIFSSIKDYVHRLNNDHIYALLFLLAEQSWRIGGDTEVKPAADGGHDDEAKHSENPEVQSKDDRFLMTVDQDTQIIHKSVVTCISNMATQLKSEFIPGSTNLMPAILRYLKDRNLEIRSLAFICIAGSGKRGVSPLFSVWDDPISMIVNTLQSATATATNIVNVECNIMNAFILLSQNVNHLNYILTANCNNDSIFKLLIQYAQSNDSYVRLLALTALKNIISRNEWQDLENEVYGQDLIKMLRYLFEINKNRTNLESLQNYTTQNRANRHLKIERLLLTITSYIAKIEHYQNKLLIGDEPNIVKSLINDIIINTQTSSYHSFLSSLSLYNLSQNKQCLELLVDEKCIESSLQITLNYINSLKHCYVSLSTIANLCSLNSKQVINGRDYYLTTQHQQIINNQQPINIHKKFPLFALETLHKIFFDLNNIVSDNNNDVEYSLSSIHSLISLIAARITSHKQFTLNNMDLCYLNTICCYFTSTDFFTQTYALITFLNFLCKSTTTVFKKIICSKAWISILLALIPSTNLSVKNIVLKCILKIIDTDNDNNDDDNKPLRNKLENKPSLLRFLDELFCDSHFPFLLQLSFDTQNINQFTLIAISRIVLILSENMPISTLLMDRNNGRNQLLSALVEFTLNPNQEIKLNGAAAISCFLSSSDNNNNNNIPFKILQSSQDNRGLMAFYEMITNKTISTFVNKNRYLNANNVEEEEAIGYAVIRALSLLSNNIQFTKDFVSTRNGLAIITNEILYGIATQSFEAAQILRNVCKQQENIKIFLAEHGCKCLLRFISSKSIQLQYLAAATLADIVYHATETNVNNNNDAAAENLFVLTTEHLSPFMTTISDCLLVLLQSGSNDKCVTIPTVKSLNNNQNDKNELNGRKLVGICLNLMHRLCIDNDNCKKLIVESGAIKPLCIKYREAIKYKYERERELILNILKCLSTFKPTQIQFLQQNGDNILNILVNQHTSNNDENAAQIISSLCKNVATHKLIATKKIYSSLLSLRHSQNNQARKLSMDTLLTFLENTLIYEYVRNDVDLAQTLAAISKFGASKHIKSRATKIIKNMLGNKAYLEITQNQNSKNKNKNTHKFAKPKLIKSPKIQKNNKNETHEKSEKKEINDKENEAINNTQTIEKSVDFWHDQEQQAKNTTD